VTSSGIALESPPTEKQAGSEQIAATAHKARSLSLVDRFTVSILVDRR
jgi:hypothetical protein